MERMRAISIVPCILMLMAAACGSGSNDRAQGVTTPTPSATSASAGEVRNPLTDLLERYRDESRRVRESLDQPRFPDPAWRTTTTDAIERTRGILAEMRQAQPPACMQAAHQEVIRSTGLLEQALAFAELAVREGDDTARTASQRRMAEAQDALDRSTDLIRQATC